MNLNDWQSVIRYGEIEISTNKLQYNQIYCMDCLDFLKLIPDNSIDLIIIDPPYGGVVRQEWDNTDILNEGLVTHLKRVLRESGNVYCFCGIGEKSQSAVKFFLLFKKHFIFKDWITWKKCRGNGNRKGWLFTREEILWFVKNNKKFIWNTKHQYSNELRKLDGFYKDGKKLSDRMKSKYKRLTNVWTDIPEITIYNSYEWSKLHIAAKPITLISRIIQVHTQENDTVLDCFAGSGTTGMACKRLNRRFLLCDNNAEYVKLATKRINEMLL